LPGQAPAAAPASALPPAAEIITRYVKALGGREAVLRHASRRAVGTFSLPAQGITGTLELVAARPDRFLLKVSLPGIGDLLTGHDGEIGWMVNPMTGPMLLGGKQRVEFEGRPTYKVRAVRANGDEDFEFYDVETGLLAGSVVTRESPLGAMKATNVMTDYRAFGGLQVPTRQIQRVMGTEQVLIITSVEFGAVDASSFAPPAAIRALVKSVPRR
jgi:hypothetical protein